MQRFTLILFSALICCALSVPYKKQSFCQEKRCLTCVGKYCTTTCRGEDCEKCPIGDCCNGTNCNICRGSNCCPNSECNNCVIGCLNKCKGKPACHHDCFETCLQHNKAEGYSEDGIINNFSPYVPKNITTVINITNSVENNNTIYHPVIINATRFENHNIIVPGNANSLSSKCCEVIHPEACRNDDKNICYTRKHKECSALCVSSHVHIVKTPEEVKDCVLISEQPFFYCNHYKAKDCDACYNCKQDCNEACPSECQGSLIEESFYNMLYRKN